MGVLLNSDLRAYFFLLSEFLENIVTIFGLRDFNQQLKLPLKSMYKKLWLQNLPETLKIRQK